MPLFQWGNFKSASGVTLPWKIECDALTDGDWKCIANVAMQALPPFGRIRWVPTGGAKLGMLLAERHTKGCRQWLLVDDVWTSGSSMRKLAREYKVPADWIGFVAFARGELPPNVGCFARIEDPYE